jgi:serine/threonine protein kinase
MSEPDAQRERFVRIEMIFATLCELPSDAPDQIEAKLIELCEGDESIEHEIRAMLQLDREASVIVDEPAFAIDLNHEPQTPIPERIGPYEIIRVLGEGGMGIVYEAQQQSPARRVALKVIRDRMIHSTLRARFQREAQILAKLNHQGIATVFESGITEDHRIPYVAMEYIDGVPITSYSESNQLSVEDRAKLLVKVCEAVGHAHTMGIVHRDIKPNNIIVDHHGKPIVLDFGIALDTGLTEHTAMTQTGQLLGTLQYMAPEQIDRSHAESAPQTDVYALGLIGYELFTGRNPHASDGSSMFDLIRMIRDDEPETMGAVDRALRGDLEIIIAKALAREQDRRYINATEFARDLERFLTLQPILARRASTWYQLRKFSRRNPVLVGAFASVIFILCVAIVLIADALRTATQDRQIAQEKQRAQELTALFVTEDLFSAGNPNFGGDSEISLLDAMRQASDKISDRFGESPEAEADISYTMSDQFRLMNDFDKALFHMERCVQISREIPDLPIDELAGRYLVLIDIYNDIDDLDKALELMIETRAMLDSSDQASPGIRIDALVQHASLLYYQRDIEGSGQLFKEALILGEQFAPGHNGTVDAATALAMVYTSLEQYDEAEDMHKLGIEMRKATNGPEHPSTLQAMDNYALQLFLTEEFEVARALLEDVYSIRIRVFGPDHNKTILNRALVGRTYMELGDFEQAERLLHGAYNDLSGLLGADHRYTLVTKGHLHTLYIKWDKSDQAELFKPE